MVQDALLSAPVALPPLSSLLRDELSWKGGDTPPHGADNGDHFRLDSAQVCHLVTSQIERYFFLSTLEKCVGI